MKNWVTLLALLALPSLALIGCASTDEDEPQNHYWQEEEEGDEHGEREERMEREIYRDK
jgi:outer membrane biogenesis lipoprotein LolB